MNFVPTDITSEKMKCLKVIGPTKDVIHSKSIPLNAQNGSGNRAWL